MCGFAGYFSPLSPPPDTLARMVARLRHRGPDAEGFHHDGPISLGHTRLSVIDPALSAQPMVDVAAGLALVYNGEIYNFRELRAELLELGHSFRTQGDTEVLLRGYVQWGVGILERIAGMFAFALWDQQRQALFLARDHLGVKPLHYGWRDGHLVFGSEIKALLEHPVLSRELDPEAIGLYLECQYIPAPRTIYTDVCKLQPGHYLWFEAGRLEQHRYWLPSYQPKLFLAEPEAVAELETRLRASVESMLVADVPLGAFVSGGIDSSLVAALMTDCLGKPVDTFHLGFLDGPSEHEEAASVARHLGSHHHALMVNPDDVLAAVDAWVEVFDEPFGDQAALPTMLLAKLTRQHVTVALTGAGADEVFAGYGNYRKRIEEERLTSWLGGRFLPLRHLWHHLPASLRKDRVLKAAAQPLARRYTTIPNLFDSGLRNEWFSTALLDGARSEVADTAEMFYGECDSPAYLDHLLHVDLRLWLPDDLLTKVDRATMAYSLEARVPYLDHRLVEFVSRLPPDYKLRGDTRKYLLKRVAEKYLPAAIVHRQKQGFVMPLSEWLAAGLAPLLEECLGPGGLDRRNLFRSGALARLLQEQRQGRRQHGTRLWALLVLELWFRRHAPDFTL